MMTKPGGCYAGIIACLCGCGLCGLARIGAAVFYDVANHAIRVVNYAEAAPCNLATLARLDKVFGWGKVSRVFEDCGIAIGETGYVNV